MSDTVSDNAPPEASRFHLGLSLEGVRRDLPVATIVAVAMVVTVWAAEEPGAKEPDLLAGAFAVALGAVFLLRTSSTQVLLVAAIALSWGYHASGYPGGPPLTATLLALYFASADGHRNFALVLGLFQSLGAVQYRWLVEGDNPLALTMIAEPALALAAVMLGDATHARRRWMEEATARLEMAETEREQEALRRVDEERLRIARELHDILGHTLAVVNVQSNVASELIEDDPQASRAALVEIRRASREAMTELRATVGVLRQDEPAPRAPTPRLRDLDRILDHARQAGLEVAQAIEGEPRSLSAPVDLAAFRVLQEGVTNVVKHAEARSLRVAIRYESAGVALEVADDGRRPAADRPAPGRAASGNPESGHGLRGMRERVESLGGRLEAAPGDREGFVVRAWLPAEPEAVS